MKTSYLAAGFLTIIIMTGCGKHPAVTVYASQDQVYAEPILNDFTRQTGIRVRAVFDSEAVKTVGLVNRLIAERDHPKCDIFWNNEELRTRQLESRGVLRQSNSWAAVGYRSRRIVINTNLIRFESAPRSLTDLTNSIWKRKIALAYPLFGTTATHFLALRQHWGDARWGDWCRALRANDPFLVDGNSVVVQFVGRGEAAIGLTDSDDIAAGQQQKFPIAPLPLSEESLLIPNTIGVIRNSAHPAEAQRLFEYLQSRTVVESLIKANALEDFQPADHTGLHVNWPNLLRDLDTATAFLKDTFLRH